jgi:hypothetical protein
LLPASASVPQLYCLRPGRENVVPARDRDGKPFAAKGPTGMPVRTLVHLAMNWKA